MIDALAEDDPALHAAFLDDRRAAEGESAMVRNSGLYPLVRSGRRQHLCRLRRAGPPGHSAGRPGWHHRAHRASPPTTPPSSTSRTSWTRARLASLYDFENRRGIFPGVHRSYKFCLLTLTGAERPADQGAQFVFFALDVADLRDPERRFTLSAADIALLNPNTRTCPIFRSRATPS